MKVIKSVPKWSVALAVVLAMLGMAAWQSWRWWTWAIAAPLSSGAPPAKNVKLQIDQGTSAQEIGQNLASLGVIRSATAWNLWTRWLMFKEPQGGFQAGRYELIPTQTMPEIASKIWTGDVMRRSFTIPEGWSIKQMATYFEQEGFFSAESFVAAAAKFPIARYPWLPLDRPPGASRLEGFLYPDTYDVTGSPTPDGIIEQMLTRFEQVALPVYQKGRGQTSLTFAEWVTLASIVEKEAVVAEERARIAGVFHNRLKKGMTLGADPTVEYGLGIQQTPDRTLTLEEVKTPSPYNTYINPGLPPTPIASPGIASLKATLYPEKTDYLYFVARYDGTHVFSRTLAEHQAAQTAIHDQREATPPTPSAR